MNILEYFLERTIDFLPKFLRIPLMYQNMRLSGKLEQEVFYLDKLIVKEGCAIDIGANKGIYTYALAKLCTSVEAFEPQKWCTESIFEYAKIFRKNIKIHNCGLSDSNGVLKLKIPIVHGRIRTALATENASFQDQNREHKSVDVPIFTLDKYDFKNVVFIKIDVEGHEQKVLKGAKNTIVKEKPVILIEIEQRHIGNEPMETIFNQIKSLGYHGFFLYEGKLLNIEDFSYEKYQKPYLSNVFYNRVCGNYVNNFIFVSSDLDFQALTSVNNTAVEK